MTITRRRCWKFRHSLPDPPYPLLKTSRAQPHAFGNLACLPLDIPLPSHYRLSILCWAYNLRHPCRRQTIALPHSTRFLGMHFICVRSRQSFSLAQSSIVLLTTIYELQQFSVLVHQIQLPEDAVPAPQPAPTTPNPTPNAAPPAPTGPNPSPSLPTAAATPILPTQVAQTTLPASQQSFFQFFIHHVRTDPQARLCTF